MNELQNLQKLLSAAHEDAFYSECVNPVTEEQKRHNQKLADNIRNLENTIKVLQQ